MTLLRTTSLGLVALLTACGQPAEPQSLAGDVTRLSQDVTRGARRPHRHRPAPRAG
jgi:hypothetical protein